MLGQLMQKIVIASLEKVAAADRPSTHKSRPEPYGSEERRGMCIEIGQPASRGDRRVVQLLPVARGWWSRTFGWVAVGCMEFYIKR